MSINIRPAQIEDLSTIVSIYNQSIAKKGLTADLEAQEVSDKTEWFSQHTPERYPIYVSCKDDGEIIAWASLSPYREGRKALQNTVEISIYLSHTHLGKGIGTHLMEHSLASARSMGYRNIIAILIGSNEASVALFRKFKFQRWGLFPGIVEIDNTVHDHCIYGRSL